MNCSLIDQPIRQLDIIDKQVNLLNKFPRPVGLSENPQSKRSEHHSLHAKCIAPPNGI